MDTWTRQKGYPVIVLKRLPNGHYLATQERFLSSPNATSDNDEKSPFNYKWEIPLTYKTQNLSRALKWFHLNDSSVTM